MAGGLAYTAVARLVYIARNQTHIVMSYFYHMRAMKWHNILACGTISTRYGKGLFGDWFDHACAGVVEAQRHILFLKYENIKSSWSIKENSWICGVQSLGKSYQHNCRHFRVWRSTLPQNWNGQRCTLKHLVNTLSCARGLLVSGGTTSHQSKIPGLMQSMLRRWKSLDWTLNIIHNKKHMILSIHV